MLLIKYKDLRNLGIEWNSIIDLLSFRVKGLALGQKVLGRLESSSPTAPPPPMIVDTLNSATVRPAKIAVAVQN